METFTVRVLLYSSTSEVDGDFFTRNRRNLILVEQHNNLLEKNHA